MTSAPAHTFATPSLAPGRSADQASRLRAIMDAAVGAAPERAAPVAAAPPRPRPERGPAKIIAIASGKGGVGKTNIAVNLSIALAAQGCRTTLVDADLGTANADVLCGLMPGARLEHIFRADASGAPRSLRDIVVEAPGGFHLVPGTAGVARMADLAPADRDRLITGIADLERTADVILVDTAAGVGAGVLSFLQAADLALVIATPEPTAIADAYALIKCLFAARLDSRQRTARGQAFLPTPATGPAAAQSLGLIVNQAADIDEARRVHARIAAVCARFLGLTLPFCGAVAQDLHIAAAVRERRPFLLHSPRSHASRDIQGLATILTQQLALSRPRAIETPRPARLPALLARLVGGRTSG